MQEFVYQAFVSSEDDGGYSVEFPDLPGCLTCGDTFEESIFMAADAAKTWLASRMVHNEPIPSASRRKAPASTESVYVFIETEPEYIVRGEAVTASEAARMLNVSPGRITQMIDAGILEGYRSERRTFVSKASVKQRLQNGSHPGRPAKQQA